MIGAQNGRHRYTGSAASCDPANTTDPANMGTVTGQRTASEGPIPTGDTSVRAGEITAHRAWLWDGHCLHSMAARCTWQPAPQPRAMYFDSPGYYEGGYHAFKSHRHVKKQYAWKHDLDKTMVIYGTVSLWGLVYEHTKGYRAEYVAIKSLDAVFMPWPGILGLLKQAKEERELLVKIRKLYGV